MTQWGFGGGLWVAQERSELVLLSILDIVFVSASFYTVRAVFTRYVGRTSECVAERKRGRRVLFVSNQPPLDV